MSTISGWSSSPSEVSDSSAWTKLVPSLPPRSAGAEELAHAAVPVDHPEDAGKLVALLELLDGRFEHPQLAVVVDDDLLAEAVVPQAQHHVDHHLAHHVLAHDDGAGHAHVMIRVAAVVQRRQRQVDRRAAPGGVAPHPFADLADVEGVGRARQMLAVHLGAADGDEDDVVLLAVRLHLPADGGLDVGARLAPFDRRRHAVLGQDGVDLGVAGIPDTPSSSDRRRCPRRRGRVGWWARGPLGWVGWTWIGSPGIWYWVLGIGGWKASLLSPVVGFPAPPDFGEAI